MRIGYHFPMYIESVPNRDSPPAILLRESYREAGKVKKRTLLNLSDWPHERIAGFKALLKGGTTGLAVVAGRSSQSLIYKAITDPDDEDFAPVRRGGDEVGLCHDGLARRDRQSRKTRANDAADRVGPDRGKV